jgi:hypothetical protein
MTQSEAILEHLKSGLPLTPLEALERFGCLRLAARCREIREAGYPIETTIRREGRKHWAEYRLSDDQ